MVLNLTEYIGEQIKALNPYLDAFAVNCIKLKGGEIVNFIGEEKTNYSPTDIVGMGAYIRIDPNIKYAKQVKRNTSCENKFIGSAQFRLVVFSINQFKRPHPYKLENKLTGDINGLNFGTYTGKEQEITCIVNSANLNFVDNFVSELSTDHSIPAESVIIALNCTLSWSFRKEDCIDNCNIWEEVSCQNI